MKCLKNTAVFIAALVLFLCAPACFAESVSPETDFVAAIPARYLDVREAELYNKIIENLTAISEGRQDAEAFYINISSPFKSNAEYEKAVEKAMFFVSCYAPEYTYWSDSDGYLIYNTMRCGIVYGVSPAYRARGNDKRIHRDKLYAANKALANARDIAEKYRDKSDYEKIVGYAKEICALNEYNHEAVDDENYYLKDISPWNLIYVFDRDPSTNVACAGYAKAFQYICGLGGIECHYVSGEIEEGRHAWNIAVLDGKNYFVDMTACDNFPESVVERFHPHVLNSVVSSSPTEFETFFSGRGYISSNTYRYDDKVLKYLPSSLLTLSTKPLSGGFKVTLSGFIGVILLICAALLFIAKRKRDRELY